MNEENGENIENQWVRIKEPHNLTTRFCFPMVGLQIPDYKWLAKYLGIKEEKVIDFFGFKNLYLEFPDYPFLYKNCFFLLFNPEYSVMGDWSLFRDIYTTNPLYQDDVSVDYGVVVVIFKIPRSYIPIVNDFRRGKYSSMYKDGYAGLYFVDRSVRPYVEKEEYKIIVKDPNYKRNLEEKIGETLPYNYEIGEKPSDRDLVLNYKLKY